MKHFLPTVLLLLIVPYCVLSFGAFPHADDYGWTNEAIQYGHFRVIGVFYKLWTGRYFSTLFFGWNPLVFKSILGYQLIPIVLLAGLVAMGTWLSRVWLQTRWTASLAVSLILLHLWIVNLPDLAQGIFWMAGSITYTMPIILLGCMLAVTKASETRLKNRVAIPLVILLASGVVGSNETIMLVTLCLLIGWLILDGVYRRRCRGVILSGFLSALISAAVILLAPGNNARISHHEKSKQLAYSLIKSLEHSLDWVGHFLQSPLFWAASVILLLILIDKQRLQGEEATASGSRNIPLGLQMLFGFALIYSSIFPAFWSLGTPPPDRVATLTIALFLGTWMSLLKTGSVWISTHAWGSSNIGKPGWLYGIAIGCFILSLISHPVTQTTFEDLFNGSVPRSRAEFKDRMQLLAEAREQGKTDMLPLPVRTEYPRHVFMSDLDEDPGYWANYQWARYYKVKKVKVFYPESSMLRETIPLIDHD